MCGVANYPRFTHWVSLPLDKELPEAERPAFRFRFLSGKGEEDLGKALKIGPGDLVGDVRSKLKELLAPLIVETRNFGTPPDRPQPAGVEALEHLMFPELIELALEVLERNTVAYGELKQERELKRQQQNPAEAKPA